MIKDKMVKLKKVGNSQAVIIPSNFLKEVGDISTIEMKIESNEIRLVFGKAKSLQELVDEKRERNKGLRAKMMKEIEKIDPDKYTNNNYLIEGDDDLID